MNMNHGGVLGRVAKSAIGVVTLLQALLLTGPAAQAQPHIDALSHASLARSGRLDVFGRNFGSGMGGSIVTIGGVAAIATSWSDTEIHAYVPEAAALGSVAVQIETAGGSSNAIMLEVAPPVTTGGGRVRWRFRLDSRFSGEFVSVAPDGTVYVSDLSRLYALTPQGELLWVVAGAGRRRPISLGPDGTIYTAGNLIKAINPDGTLKWEYRSPFRSELLAGPSVGPDGNIYAVQNTWSTGLGAFALDPDGELLFSDPDNPLMSSNADSNSSIVFRRDMFYVGIRVSAAAQPVLNAFDFDGNQLWSGIHRDRDLHTQTFPKLDPSGRVIVSWGQTAIQAITPDGQADWRSFPPNGASLFMMPGIDADGVIYVGSYFFELWAINPDGTTRWATSGSSGILDTLNVPPDGSIILAGGVDGYGQPGWVRAYDTADGAFMWQVDLPLEQGFNQLVQSQQPTFTPDSRTAYVTTGSAQDVSGFLYAIDTGPEGAVILPESFEVTRGVLVAGALPDLLDSDDGYVEVSARRPTELAAASAEITVTATATTDTPGVLEFTVEAASTGAPARQRIEMFDYDAGEWEVVDEREAPASDTVVTVSISENAPRFVDPQTLEVKTRIGYVDLGITFPSWRARFDQVFWTVAAR